MIDSSPNKPSFLSYRGRARRRTYWFATLGIGIVATVAACVALLPLLNELANGGMDDLEVAMSRSACGLLIAFAVIVMALILLLPVNVRRLHDRNMSGWWMLVFILGGMIPYVGQLIGLVQFVIMGCLDGTPGPNRYGLDPKGRK